jgi:hypothetical protein
MNARELTQTLYAMVEGKIPTFLWGAPGIGKSSIVKQVAQAKNIGFIDLRLALMDPTDLKGIPFYDKQSHSALWAPPAFLPKEGRGILFLDELNTASPSVQASAYQLILDRAIGEYKLPDGWAVVAAGNRDTDRGVTYKMASPLANRFVHLELEVSVQEWRVWAYSVGLDSRVIAYIGYKNEHLFTFDATSKEKSFATPRSWEYVAKILASNLEVGLLLESISGAVGKEVAVGFLSFVKVMKKLPDLEMILEANTQEYPKEIDVLYALASGLVSRYLHNPTDERLENLLHYTLELQSEFSVMIVQDLQKNGVKMEHLKVFERWVEKFAYLLA